MKSEWSIPFRNKSFTWFFIGQAVSRFGDWAAYVIIPILIYHLTSTATSIGYLMICRLAPTIFLSPFIGRLMKKFSMLSVMIFADLVRGVGYLAFLFVKTPLEVYALTTLLAVGSAFFNPGCFALIPTLVPENALARANSYIGGVGQFAMLVGPAVGGVVFSFTGMQAGLIFDALTFFFSMVSLTLVRLPRMKTTVPEEAPAIHDKEPSAASVQKESAFTRFAKTLQGSRKRRLLFMLLTVGSLPNMGFGGTLTAMFPLLASDVFHSPQRMYGAIMSLLGGGIFLGTMVAPNLLKKFACYPLIVWGSVIGGMFAALFGNTSYAAVALAMIFLVGFCNGVQDIDDTTYVQQVTSEQGDTADMLSLQQATLSTVFILATVIASQLSAHFGPQLSVVTMSAIPVLAGLVMWGKYLLESKEGEQVRNEIHQTRAERTP